MSESAIGRGTRSNKLVTPARRYFWPCVAVLYVAAILWNQAWGWLNPDTSWLIYLNERMFSGEKLYVDVWESNPPLSVILLHADDVC